MDGFMTFQGTLTRAGLAGELWIDGSFITEKIDPDDIDVVVRCPCTLYDNGTPEQRAALDWVSEDHSETLGCHSFLLIDYPPEHVLYDHGQWMYSYWHRQWGFTREPETPKGIVVVELAAVANEPA